MSKLLLFILTMLSPVKKIMVHGKTYALNSQHEYNLLEVSKILCQSLQAPKIAEGRANALKIIAQFVCKLDSQPSLFRAIYEKALLGYDPTSVDENGVRIEGIEGKMLYISVGRLELLLAVRVMIQSANEAENSYAFAIVEKSEKIYLLPKSYFCEVLDDTNTSMSKPEPEPEAKVQTHTGSYSPKSEELIELEKYFSTKCMPQHSVDESTSSPQSDTIMQEIGEIMMIFALYIVLCLLYIIGITLVINVMYLISHIICTGS